MDELTDEQIEELHSLLLEQLSELEKSLTATTEGAKAVDLDEPIGRLSRMEAMQQQQMAKANRDRARSQLQLTRAAIQAIENDEDYGYCRQCEEPIGYRRLKARPESPVCLGCQSARERR